MIANNRISAVLVSTDLARSQEFYEKKVGLTLSPGLPLAVLADGAAASVRLADAG
jgi:hypothetical protein